MRVKESLRYELKYLIDRDQYWAVRDALASRMLADRHGNEDGAYRIASLYYDTSDHRAYWDKIEGHKVRRKVRVRIYGGEPVTPETPAFLEIKQRMDRLMAKRRESLPYAEAVNFAAFDDAADASGAPDRPVRREVSYLYRTLQLRPSAVVTYDRLAYEGDETYPDLRVTFDTNLRGRVRDLSLLSAGYAEDSYFLAPDRCLLEVKVNRTVPYWLTKILSDQRCTLRRISKYCAALESCGAIRDQQRIVVYSPVRP